MVSSDQQRAAADFLLERFGVSERRVGRVMGRSRSTLRYRRRRRSDEAPLVRSITRLARDHARYGYRRIHAMLIRKGWSVNLKRVRRPWNELGLKRPVRLRKPGKQARNRALVAIVARLDRLCIKMTCGRVILSMTGPRKGVRSSG